MLVQKLEVGVVATKSPLDEKSVFLPVFRSGSCAERGPKQYMEDEHVCIDNLIEHLGDTTDFPSPGAFYGVSISIAHKMNVPFYSLSWPVGKNHLLSIYLVEDSLSLEH